MRGRYKIIFLVTALIAAIAVFIIYGAFEKYFNDVYKHNTELSILESKKGFPQIYCREPDHPHRRRNSLSREPL